MISEERGSWQKVLATLIAFLALGGCCRLVKEGPYALKLSAREEGTYRIGEFFNLGQITLEVEQLPASSADGFATIEKVPGSPYAIRCTASSIHYGLPYPLKRVDLEIEAQGRLRLRINGETQSVLDPADLVSPSTPLSLVVVEIANHPGHKVTLEGDIRDLRLGGADVRVNDFSYEIDTSGLNLQSTGGVP